MTELTQRTVNGSICASANCRRSDGYRAPCIRRHVFRARLSLVFRSSNRDVLSRKRGSVGGCPAAQFVLAELAAETLAARVFTDWCIERYLAGQLASVEVAKVKLVVTNLHVKVIDQCLQFFGVYGYMTEYPIARAYIDARIVRIAGGAAEVMKQIIRRDLFRK